MKILVASDSPMEVMRATSGLGIMPTLELTIAENEKDARTALLADTYDLLIMDGDMRPRGGYAVLYELAARLEMVGELPPPAIVLVSRKLDAWLANWASAVEVHEKPVDALALSRQAARLAGYDLDEAHLEDADTDELDELDEEGAPAPA